MNVRAQKVYRLEGGKNPVAFDRLSIERIDIENPEPPQTEH
jgi:hypothetical protein